VSLLRTSVHILINGIIGNWLSHSENPTSHELAIEMELGSLPFSEGPWQIDSDNLV
jgi:hypothetical protein